MSDKYVSNSNEFCNTCVHFRRLKELVNSEWVIKSCCTLWPDVDGQGYDNYVIVVDSTDFCECYEHNGG